MISDLYTYTFYNSNSNYCNTLLEYNMLYKINERR